MTARVVAAALGILCAVAGLMLLEPAAHGLRAAIGAGLVTLAGSIVRGRP